MITKELQEKLKNKLEKEKKFLEEDLLRFAKLKNNKGDYETQFNNIGTSAEENALEVEEYADNLALENDLEKQLAKINKALEKIEKGNFGICEKCGQEIEIDRLQAYPAAQKCVSCSKNS